VATSNISNELKASAPHLLLLNQISVEKVKKREVKCIEMPLKILLQISLEKSETNE